jgi:hypothetical protein
MGKRGLIQNPWESIVNLGSRARVMGPRAANAVGMNAHPTKGVTDGGMWGA